MRWTARKYKDKHKHMVVVERTMFLYFPLRIGDEVRWLESVTIRGYWWYGASGTWYWESQMFID